MLRRIAVVAGFVVGTMFCGSTLSAGRAPGEEPPPPLLEECERCEQLFEASLERCLGPDGALRDGVGDECVQAAEREADRCRRACVPEEKSPEEECFYACELLLDEALVACRQAAGGEERDAAGFPFDPAGEIDECFVAAFEQHDVCTLECQPEEVRCAAGCRQVYSEAQAACASVEDPAERRACQLDSDEAFLECSIACGTPESETCYLRCEVAYVRELESCAEALEGELGPDGDRPVDGIFDEVCAERAHIAFERCHIECSEEQDEEFCGVLCDLDLRAAYLDCEGEECAEAEARHEACLADCGIKRPDPPEPRPCFGDCEEDRAMALARCEDSDDPDGQCVELVHLRFERCLVSCDEDEKPECPRLCDLDFQEAMLGCEGEECDEARKVYEGCLRECGIDVPELPDPDPCLSRCDLAFQSTLERCYAGMERAGGGAGRTAAGDPEPDPDPFGDECFARADAVYVTCLADCGVEIPPPLDPADDDGCVEGCDGGYEQAFIGCFDEATGEVDRDCVAATDRRYLECLVRCGVELPENPKLPGPAGDACISDCDETLLGGIFGCYDATGELSIDCILQLVADFEACRSSCTAAEQDSILAAALRGSQSEVLFLRGDATRNEVLELTDAVLVLENLFLRSVETACPDASDANDDGRVNVTDPIRLLGWLFLGTPPLPAPSEAPGRDPTPDLLTCRG